MNLAALVRLQASQRPAQIALRFKTRTWTYAELWRGVAASMASLKTSGVGAGDRVAVCLADTPAHVVLHYAIAGLGACLVPIDHRGTDAEIGRIAGAFDAGLLLHDEGRDVHIDGIGTAAVAADFADGDTEATLVDRADEPWLVSLSSGTTGRPKGALVTHRQMRERFVTQWVTLGFNCADRFALVTPLVFGAGRSFAMSTLAAGGELVLAPPPLKPDELVVAINDSGATTTFLVPTLMRRLLELPGDGRLLPGLRCLVISGEAFFPHEIEPFRRRLSDRLIGYYASSEGGGVSVLQPDDFAAHGTTVGQAAFGVEVEIADPDGNALPPGKVGELRYRGPGVTTQDLGSDGRLVPGDPAGWFYPGDLAERGDNGFIALRGRAKDVINRAGVNIYPLEIEHALRGYDGVLEAAVVGYRAGNGRDEIAAFVVAQGVDPDALSAYLADRLAPYKCPKRIECLQALPRAASGKTDKAALSKRAEAAG